MIAHPPVIDVKLQLTRGFCCRQQGSKVNQKEGERE
jgi:hypothetical protein